MSLLKSNDTAINKNNGSFATLENFSNCKEGFAAGHFWNKYNYTDVNHEAQKGDPQTYAQEIIDSKIKPLEKQAANWENTHGRISSNYDSIISDYDRMVKLRDQLNEVPPFTTETIEVGASDSNTILVDIPDVDMSYQRITVPDIVDSTNEGAKDGSFPPTNVFSVKMDGKTMTVEKKFPLMGDKGGSVGWNFNLKINYKVETIPNKKYYHHADDWELGETRKNQREKHMADTKELLLYTNQFYIIGSITTGLALIFAYKNYS
jgi:hypothetical protein